MTTPLSVLDLMQVAEGSTPADAIGASIDLVQRAERLGYARYWFAEHHLNPGMVGVSPALSIALAAGSTRRIRLGSAGVQIGHRTPLSVVEEFGLLAAVHPGRLDLGIGRSIGRAPPSNVAGADDRSSVAAAIANYRAAAGGKKHTEDERTQNGLLLPKGFDRSRVAQSPRLRLTLSLLQQPGAYTPRYSEQIGELVALLGGSYRSTDGLEAHSQPGEGSAVELWILGASGGESADVAGAFGLRFAASYHHTPSTVLDAVSAYREAFRPGMDLSTAYIAVSADAVVAPSDAEARHLASGYGLWVRSIRSGDGAIPYPHPETASRHRWSEEDRALVHDRVETQFVGSPQTVADRLEQLRDATGADELAVTTMTHRHADRVRSYELLAAEWKRRGLWSATNDHAFDRP